MGLSHWKLTVWGKRQAQTCEGWSWSLNWEQLLRLCFREPSLLLCDDLEGCDAGRGGKLKKEGIHVYIYFCLSSKQIPLLPSNSFCSSHSTSQHPPFARALRLPFSISLQNRHSESLNLDLSLHSQLGMEAGKSSSSSASVGDIYIYIYINFIYTHTHIYIYVCVCK